MASGLRNVPVSLHSHTYSDSSRGQRSQLNQPCCRTLTKPNPIKFAKKKQKILAHDVSLPGNKHVDDGVKNEHEKHVTKVKVVVEGDVVGEVVPLDALSPDLQESYRVDSQTHAGVGENGERYLSSPAKQRTAILRVISGEGYALSSDFHYFL